MIIKITLFIWHATKKNFTQQAVVYRIYRKILILLPQVIKNRLSNHLKPRQRPNSLIKLINKIIRTSIFNQKKRLIKSEGDFVA